MLKHMPISLLLILSLGLSSASEAANRKVERAIKRSKSNAAQVAEVTGQVQALEDRVTGVEETANGNAETISENALDTGLALDELYVRVEALEESVCNLSDGSWDATTSMCSFGRFQACDDGLTVADIETGLLWERKTNDSGLHDVDNRYSWSSSGTAFDGTAKTIFLEGLNNAAFAGHTDWRLPYISELQSILIGPGVTTVAAASPADPASGLNETEQATSCSAAPCIDPDFANVGGPTASSGYWSASSFAPFPTGAWFAFFANGDVAGDFGKTGVFFVRAVRAGSCGL
jgi:hypothetical protein